MYPRRLSSLGIILCLCSVGSTEELTTDPTEVLHDADTFFDKPNQSEQIIISDSTEILHDANILLNNPNLLEQITNEVHQEQIPDLRFKIKREINDDDEDDSLESEFAPAPSSEEGDSDSIEKEGDIESIEEVDDNESIEEEDDDGDIEEVDDNDDTVKEDDNDDNIEKEDDNDGIENEENNNGIDKNLIENASEEYNNEENSPLKARYDSNNTTEKKSNETASEENSHDSLDYTSHHSSDLNIIPAIKPVINDSSENLDSEIPKPKVNSPKSVIHRNKSNQKVYENSLDTNINDEKYDTMGDIDASSDNATDNSSDIVRVDRYTFPRGEHEDRSSGSSGAIVIFLFFLMSIGFLTFLGIYYRKLSFSNSRYGFHSPLPMREMEEDEIALFNRENRYSSWDAVPIV